LNIDVALTNNFNRESLEVDIRNSVCAVIDAIRATTTIATLFGIGADSILITRTLDEAFRLKEYFPDMILCGEKDAIKPEGFDFGNSPLELSSRDLKGKKVIFKTTNGTKSFLKARTAPAVFSLAGANFKYTMDFIANYAHYNSRDILIICSGHIKKIAHEDTYIAGLAVKYLMTKPYDYNYSESAKLVLSSVLGEKNIKRVFSKSLAAKILGSVGLGGDIDFCSVLNSYNLLIKSSTFNPEKNIKDFKELMILHQIIEQDLLYTEIRNKAK